MLANAYVGLRPFRENEAGLFYGRDRQVKDLQEILSREQFAAVIGTSGCGKSSLLEAGLFPKLRGVSQMPWRIARLRPGGNPVGSLARALAGCKALPQLAQLSDWEEQVKFVETTLRQSSHGVLTLLDGCRAFAPEAASRLLIVADQFEELFRFHAEPRDDRGEGMVAGATPAEFVQLLLSTAGDTKRGVRVVVAMRTDFLADCVRFPGLAEQINRSNYLVPRLERDERAEAIARPAEKHGARIKAALVHDLADRFADEPDQLPILQHALHRAWDHLERGSQGQFLLTNNSILAVGGLEGALNRHAEEVSAKVRKLKIQPEEMKRAFQALTYTTADGTPVRRPLRLEQLCAVAGLTLKQGARLVGRFRAKDAGFLLPARPDKLKLDTKIDICHESLIRRWEQLKGWAAEEHQNVERWLRLEEMVKEWDHRTNPLGATELEKARIFLASGRVNLAWVSLVSRAIDPVAALAGVKETVRFATLAARRRRVVQGALSLLAIGVFCYAVFLATSNARLRVSTILAAAKEAKALEVLFRLLSGDRDAEANISDANVDLADEMRLLGLIDLQSEVRPSEVITGVSARLAERLAALSSARSEISAWKMDDLPTEVRSTISDQWKGELTRRDQLMKTLQTMMGSFGNARDRLEAARGSELSGKLRSEQVAKAIEELQNTGRTATTSIKLSSSSLALLPAEVLPSQTAADGFITNLTAHSRPVRNVAFSHDGRWILTAGNDKRALLWSSSGEQIREIANATVYADGLLKVAFSLDSKRLAVCTQGSRLVVGVPGSRSDQDVVLDARTGAAETRMVATSMAFSPDGRFLGIGCGDLRAKIWDVSALTFAANARPDENQVVHTDVVQGLLFAPVAIGEVPASACVLTASDDNWAQLWRRENDILKPLWAPKKNQAGTGYFLDNPIRSTAFSPDGRFAALTGGNAMAVLHTLDGSEAWRPIKPPWDGTDVIRSLTVEQSTFNSDGKFLAVMGRSPKVQIYEVASGMPLAALAHSNAVTNMAWSPTAPDRLLTGTVDGKVTLWRLDQGGKNGTPLRVSNRHGSGISSLAWSGDGRMFVSGSWDTTAIIWRSP